MSDAESVGERDRLLNTAVLDGLEEQGDARAAWQAVAFCTEKGLPFPQWVTRYLAATAPRLLDHLDNRDERHPMSLRYALGFDRLNEPDTYDHDRDPEVVFARITTWLTGGEVKNISEGARRYHSDVLRAAGSPETVRELFYRGRKRHFGN
jgi:hypothetical protein